MSTIDLSKKPKINLTKGNQVINLTKDGTANTEKLHKVFFGISWTGMGGADLDASIICYSRNKQYEDMIYYGQQISKDGSIQHSGDDLHGGKTSEADNETIYISLDDVSSKISYLAVVLNVYRGPSFSNLKNLTSRIYTGRAGKPDEILCSYDLKSKDSNIDLNNKYAVVFGYFYRAGNGWKFQTSDLTSKDMRLSNIKSGIAKRALGIETHHEIDEPIPTLYHMDSTYRPNYPQSENKGFISSVVDFIKNLF